MGVRVLPSMFLVWKETIAIITITNAGPSAIILFFILISYSFRRIFGTLFLLGFLSGSRS